MVRLLIAGAGIWTSLVAIDEKKFLTKLELIIVRRRESRKEKPSIFLQNGVCLFARQIIRKKK
jgi:hypothetical protein